MKSKDARKALISLAMLGGAIQADIDSGKLDYLKTKLRRSAPPNHRTNFRGKGRRNKNKRGR